MVTTVRGQAGHPIDGSYRVSYYGAETEGRSGKHSHNSHTQVYTGVIKFCSKILGEVCSENQIQNKCWGYLQSDFYKCLKIYLGFILDVRFALKTAMIWFSDGHHCMTGEYFQSFVTQKWSHIWTRSRNAAVSSEKSSFKSFCGKVENYSVVSQFKIRLL